MSLMPTWYIGGSGHLNYRVMPDVKNKKGAMEVTVCKVPALQA